MMPQCPGGQGSGDPSLSCRGRGGRRAEERPGSMQAEIPEPYQGQAPGSGSGPGGVEGLRGSGGWETKQTYQQAGKQKQEDAGKALLNVPRTMTGASGQRKGGMRRGPHLSGKWPKWPEDKLMTSVRKVEGAVVRSPLSRQKYFIRGRKGEKYSWGATG